MSLLLSQLTPPVTPDQGWIQAQPERTLSRRAMLAAFVAASQIFVSAIPDPVQATPNFGWYVPPPAVVQPARPSRPLTYAFQDFGPFLPIGWLQSGPCYPARKPELRKAELTAQDFGLFVPYGWPASEPRFAARRPERRSLALAPQDFGPFIHPGWLTSEPRRTAKLPELRSLALTPQDFGEFLPLGWLQPEHRQPLQIGRFNPGQTLLGPLFPEPLISIGWLPPQFAFRPPPLKAPQTTKAFVHFEPLVAPPFGWFAPAPPRLAVYKLTAALLNTTSYAYSRDEPLDVIFEGVILAKAWATAGFNTFVSQYPLATIAPSAPQTTTILPAVESQQFTVRTRAIQTALMITRAQNVEPGGG